MIDALVAPVTRILGNEERRDHCQLDRVGFLREIVDVGTVGGRFFFGLKRFSDDEDAHGGLEEDKSSLSALSIIF